MTNLPKVSASKYDGIGDVIHKIAQPIAKMIDAAAGTHIQTCGGCAKRRASLNSAFPFSTKPTP